MTYDFPTDLEASLMYNPDVASADWLHTMEQLETFVAGVVSDDKRHLGEIADVSAMVDKLAGLYCYEKERNPEIAETSGRVLEMVLKHYPAYIPELRQKYIQEFLFAPESVPSHVPEEMLAFLEVCEQPPAAPPSSSPPSPPAPAPGGM
ncbi:MAG: hypothetical protein H6857_01505 [Rhodospirillales bacterium]|nr:hypothetical protein [Rhodospirillales bacterium]